MDIKDLFLNSKFWNIIFRLEIRFLNYKKKICLFLLKEEENVIATHCKAGKGRIGIMICVYLSFIKLKLNSLKA